MSKQIIKFDPSEYKIFPDTHQAIISREDFQKVQEIRSKRKRITPIKERVMFGDVIFCGDCGNKMYIMRSRNWKKTKPDCYICSTSRKKGNCSSHYIQEKHLIEYVEDAINKLLLTSNDTEKLYKRIHDDITKRNNERQRDLNKKLSEVQVRVREIDNIIKNLYEDKVKGNIALDVFQKLSSDFSKEQATLNEFIFVHSKECANVKADKSNVSDFINIVKKYETGIDALTPEIVDDFIERIEVFEAKKIDGKRQQKINIHFKGIGLVNFD